MGDLTSDYEGKAWYTWHNASESKSWIVKASEIVNKGEIVEEDDGETLPFATADAKEILGVSMSNATTGDATATNADKVKVYTKITLLNCYLSGVAIGNATDVVWATGADPGSNGSSGDLTLTYAAGARVLGFVRRYRTTDKADVFVDPRRFTRRKKLIASGIGGADSNVPAAAAFFGITADFGEAIIARGISYIPSILEAAAKGYNVKLVVDGTALTGTLQVRNADTVHTEKEQAITDAAGCYAAAATEIKLEADAHEGAAPDTGMASFYVEYDEIPKCGGFIN